MTADNLINLTGKKFGRLLVERRFGNGYRPVRWECKCECGNKTVVAGDALKCGGTTSCGCYRNEICGKTAFIHGKSYTPEHGIWAGILSRCNNKKYRPYKWYGALGVKICARWQFGENGKNGFQCFLEDMGPRPSPKHSIDRIDPFGNYEPGNCQWVTRLQQINNRRNTRRVIYRGKEMALTDAVRAGGDVIHYEAAWVRISKCGWTVSDAVETPRLFLSPNSNERRRGVR